jgi:hypothetical protein
MDVHKRIPGSFPFTAPAKYMRLAAAALLFLLILFGGCVTKFIPETVERKDLLIAEGLITDQCETYMIKLSWARPLGVKYKVAPVSGAYVTVKDDLGNSFTFSEGEPGKYYSDQTVFRAEVGRKYALYLTAPDSGWTYSDYRSYPVEMRPVPPLDSLYYEKIRIRESEVYSQKIDNCQIYLDTHDETGTCRYFRWDYDETWEFHLHWPGDPEVCWLSEKSKLINIKSTSALEKSIVNKFPLYYIDENTDRLEVRYSILVNQYSLSPDEYEFWLKLRGVTQDVGGLYDLIPANIPSNIYCSSDHSKPVLGYFSVSAKSSKRLFIKDQFTGQINYYQNCPIETIYNPGTIPGLGNYLWILEESFRSIPPYIIITNDKGCVDCSLRGSTVRPSFW